MIQVHHHHQYISIRAPGLRARMSDVVYCGSHSSVVPSQTESINSIMTGRPNGRHNHNKLQQVDWNED